MCFVTSDCIEFMKLKYTSSSLEPFCMTEIGFLSQFGYKETNLNIRGLKERY